MTMPVGGLPATTVRPRRATANFDQPLVWLLYQLLTQRAARVRVALTRDGCGLTVGAAAGAAAGAADAGQ